MTSINRFNMIGSETCTTTQGFLNGHIDESGYILFLQELNESQGISQWVKDKVISPLRTLISNLGKNIKSKIEFIVSNIWKVSKRILKGKPSVLRAIASLIVILVVSSTSMASDPKSNPSTNQINAAIGLLSKIKIDSTDNMDILKAIAYLVDLKDGKLDTFKESNDRYVAVATSALNSIEAIYRNSKTSEKDTIYSIMELGKEGKKFISFQYTKAGNKEHIVLHKESNDYDFLNTSMDIAMDLYNEYSDQHVFFESPIFGYVDAWNVGFGNSYESFRQHLNSKVWNNHDDYYRTRSLCISLTGEVDQEILKDVCGHIKRIKSLDDCIKVSIQDFGSERGGRTAIILCFDVNNEIDRVGWMRVSNQYRLIMNELS